LSRSSATSRTHGVSAPTGSSPPSFKRDALTWVAYSLLFVYAYAQSSLGPVMPYLRSELGFGYTTASLHLSAFATGMIVAGSSAAWFVRHRSRRDLMWTGAAGLAFGTVGLMLAPAAWASVGSALAMGWLGSWMLVAVQAALSELHGAMGARALLEANVGASIGSGAVASVLTALARQGADWRLAFVVPLVLLAAVAFRGRAEPVDDIGAQGTPGKAGGRLPVRFWIFSGLIFIGVGVEWTIGFWAATYLVDEAALSAEGATGAVTALFIAIIAGRIYASRLTLRRAPEKLLVLSYALTAAGFPLFWLAPAVPLRVAGLVVAGLGIANLFPLGLALALAAAPNNRDAASARCSTAGGIALVILPLLVGSIADAASISLAFGVVPALLLAAAATGWGGVRASS
jgi:fucose permease